MGEKWRGGGSRLDGPIWIANDFCPEGNDSRQSDEASITIAQPTVGVQLLNAFGTRRLR